MSEEASPTQVSEEACLRGCVPYAGPFNLFCNLLSDAAFVCPPRQPFIFDRGLLFDYLRHLFINIWSLLIYFPCFRATGIQQYSFHTGIECNFILRWCIDTVFHSFNIKITKHKRDHFTYIFHRVRLS